MPTTLLRTLNLLLTRRQTSKLHKILRNEINQISLSLHRSNHRTLISTTTLRLLTGNILRIVTSMTLTRNTTSKRQTQGMLLEITTHRLNRNINSRTGLQTITIRSSGLITLLSRISSNLKNRLSNLRLLKGILSGNITTRNGSSTLKRKKLQSGGNGRCNSRSTTPVGKKDKNSQINSG